MCVTERTGHRIVLPAPAWSNEHLLAEGQTAFQAKHIWPGCQWNQDKSGIIVLQVLFELSWYTHYVGEERQGWMGCFDRKSTGYPEELPVANCTWKDLKWQWREPYEGKPCSLHLQQQQKMTPSRANKGTNFARNSIFFLLITVAILCCKVDFMYIPLLSWSLDCPRRPRNLHETDVFLSRLWWSVCERYGLQIQAIHGPRNPGWSYSPRLCACVSYQEPPEGHSFCVQAHSEAEGCSWW